MKIILESGQNLWFTSDTHYNHSNICRSTSNWSNLQKTRDFKSLNHMNDMIVNEINLNVNENDILIHLGDWSFGGFESIQDFRSRIVCKNVHLVLGNHDHHIKKNKFGVQSVFSSVCDYLYLDVRFESMKNNIERFVFVCMHYPIASWDGMNDGNIHLHGHVHLPKNLRIHDGKSMDVGVDGNEMKPISFKEIISIMKNRPHKRLILNKDHHESD